jgi:hypothetical protein
MDENDEYIFNGCPQRCYRPSRNIRRNKAAFRTPFHAKLVKLQVLLCKGLAFSFRRNHGLPKLKKC